HCFGRVNDYLAPIVQFAFVPMCAMEQMCLARCRVGGNCWCRGFIMCPSFVSSCFGGFPLWMCHYNLFLFVNSFFNVSHLGSVSSSSAAMSCLWLGLSSSSLSRMSLFKVPSSIPG